MAEGVRGRGGLGEWVVVALVGLGLWALLNVPPLTGSIEHALGKHGSMAVNAVWEYESGACTEVWRHVQSNRIVRVVGTGEVRHLIISTLSGRMATAYDQTAEYCQRRFRLAGWEFVGYEGECR